MELNCKFVYQIWRVGASQATQLYTCHVFVAEIDKPGTVIRTFNGTHQAGKSNKDVEALRFKVCEMKHFPRGIQNFFPRLRGLSVYNCGLTTIARSDLDGLKSLEALDMSYNQLKSLPSNLFVGMSKLKDIDFQSNQIESMSSDILKPVMNNGLACVDFEGNRSLNAYFWLGQPRSVASIEDLMKIIDAKCTKPTNDKLTAPDQHAYSMKSKESFASAVSDLWESKRIADFTINAGSTNFRVHKFVLATQSSKLASMFEEQEIDEINISDIDEAVIEAFLRYLYTGDAPNDVNFIQLFNLSSKLDVTVLTDYCEEMILSSLQESNAFEIFKLGHNYSNDEFKKQAFEEIRRMFPGIRMPDCLMEKPEELELLDSIKEKIEKL